MQDLQIYLARNNVQAGPYTLEQINTMLASQEVSLNDLMWHSGMKEWRPVGELTQGKHIYLPLTNIPSNNQNTSHDRLTVDELYGRESRPVNQNPYHNQVKQQREGEQQTTTNIFSSSNNLASFSSRILAATIDQLFFFMCLIPFIMHAEKNVIAELSDVTKIQHYVESLPQSVTMSFIALFVGASIIQIFCLATRGQSVGKILTGIRILDKKTNRLASVTNVVLMRTIVINIAYNLPFIGVFILIADVFIFFTDKKRQSLHDKLAGTIVVKATPEQLKKK